MRHRTIFFTATLAALALAAYGDAARSTLELQAVHAAWFTAFDSGDGTAMDQIEAPDLVLVMPNGAIWKKTEPRANTMKKSTAEGTRTLSNVTVREFGDTAVLTGLLTSQTATASETEATTVMFTKIGGKWKVASAQWTPQKKP